MNVYAFRVSTPMNGTVTLIRVQAHTEQHARAALLKRMGWGVTIERV